MTDARTGYTAGLRMLADILDANPDLPLPFDGTTTPLDWIEVGAADEQKKFAQTFARVIPGTVEKQVRDDALDLTGNIHGLRVAMIVSRDAVCTRVVTGTREITTKVSDPDALAAVPNIEVTETVKDVEWVCEPLLAEVTS